MKAPKREPNGRHWDPPDAEWLEHHYLILKKSIQVIAKEVGADRTTINRWLLGARVPLRSWSQAMDLRPKNWPPGDKSHAWRGGREEFLRNQAWSALHRAGVPRRCVRCGDTREWYLVVHHKDGDSRNNLPANLQYLCRTCHPTVHKELRERSSKEGSMELRILVIDPGETCGYAVFQLDKALVAEARPSNLELLETWEDSGASIPEFVIPFLKVLRRVKPSLVLIEDYRVYQDKALMHIGQPLRTPELIGAIIGVCNLTVPVMRTARIAAAKKGKWPEARMKAKFPQAKDVTGHARDAVKLGLAFLELKGLWIP